jgi:hypothetical protein
MWQMFYSDDVALLQVRLETAKPGIVADVSVTVTRGTLTLAREAWCGVDIHHARVQAQHGAWFMHRSLSMEAFVKLPIAAVLSNLPVIELHQLTRAIEGTTPYVPSMEQGLQDFVSNGSYYNFVYSVKLFNNHYRAITYQYANLTFEVSWANPLWDALEMDASTALLEIQQELQNTLDKSLPAGGLQQLRPADLASYPVVRPTWWQTWWWWISDLLGSVEAEPP